MIWQCKDCGRIILFVVILLAVMVAPSFALTANDYMKLTNTEVDVDHSCSYYTIYNPTLTDKTGVTAPTVISTTSKSGRISDSSWEIYTQLSRNVWQPNIVCTIIGYEDTKNETKVPIEDCVDKGKNITVNYNAYVPITSKLDIKAGSDYKVRFCANHSFVVKDKTLRISIDHIPSFSGYTYSNYAWWNASWDKVKNVSLAYNTSIAVLNVTYDPYMQPDFDDLRFIDGPGTKVLGYWIEYKENSNYALVRVNTSALGSETTFLMYYNNSAATSASNISKVYYSSLEMFYSFFNSTLIDNTGNYTTYNRGNVTFTNSGMIGGGFSFSGDTGTSCLNVTPQWPAMENGTILYWLKANKWNAYNTMVSVGNSSTSFLNFRVASGTSILFRLNNNDQTVTRSFLTNTWENYAFKWNQTGREFFINGTIIQSFPNATFPATTNEQLIGAQYEDVSNVCANPINATMDEFMLFTSELDKEDLRRLTTVPPTVTITNMSAGGLSIHYKNETSYLPVGDVDLNLYTSNSTTSYTNQTNQTDIDETTLSNMTYIIQAIKTIGATTITRTQSIVPSFSVGGDNMTFWFPASDANIYLQYFNVMDSNNNGIQGASVVIQRYVNASLELIDECTTNSAGSCSVWIETGVPYSMTVSAVGYITKTQSMNFFTGSPNPANVYLSTSGDVNMSSVFKGLNATITPLDSYFTSSIHPNCTIIANQSNLISATFAAWLYNYTTGVYDAIPGWCYQESANATTVGDGNCGIVYNGTYGNNSNWTSASFYAVSHAYDGNWSHSALCGAGSVLAYVYINYTKPDVSSTSKWSFGFYNYNISNYDRVNVSIPTQCWNQNPLQFRMTSNCLNATNSSTNGACYNGSAWQQIVIHDGTWPDVDAEVVEDAMWWDLISNDSLTNPTGGVLGFKVSSVGKYLFNCTYSWWSNASGVNRTYTNTVTETKWITDTSDEGIATGVVDPMVGAIIAIGVAAVIGGLAGMYSPTFGVIIAGLLLLMFAWWGFIAWYWVALPLLTAIALLVLRSGF